MKTYKISGHEAIRLAERDSLTIYCHNNPVDEGGEVDLDKAKEIATEDPALLYVQVVPRGWWAMGRKVEHLEGYSFPDYFGPSGKYLGPDCNGTELTFRDA